MKTLTKLFILLLSFVAVACSDSDGYNADTAETPYEPVPGRRAVARVKTTNTIDGREYSWEHNFTYDAHGRIKEINTGIKHHTARMFLDKVFYYECNITSKANYYYRGKKLDISYTLTGEYPEYPDWNYRESATDNFLFNDLGLLVKLPSLDLVYSATQLHKAYTDAGNEYTVRRDARGNVTGYVVYSTAGDSIVRDKGRAYGYSQGLRNRTNFDFSAYFGYWGVEQALYANRTEYYASYQLGAFGMLGATSEYLPVSVLNGNGEYEYGTWEMDSEGYPVSFTDATGRKTVITYVE